MAVFRVFLCAVLLALGVQSATVTPMEKVIKLLKDLSAKVTADGQKEAAEYDKYACFCKEQADEKLYAIEKSDAKLASLKAEITDLNAAISELNGEIKDLSTKISGLATDIELATSKRATEHARYQANAKDMNEAIGACGAAIKALKDSKTSMKGAKLDFAQVKKAAQGLVGVSQQVLKTADPHAIALLAELGGKEAPKFEYQSNTIIATLESLLDTFKGMKKDLDVEEFDINAAFDSKVLGYNNEKSFAEKEKAEKETVVASKETQLEAAKNDRDEEQEDRDADDEFMNELTTQCEEKATLFDQRSKMRGDELKTLQEATVELESGAVPNESANKKLVGLPQKSAVVQKAAVSPKALSFVQINEVQFGEKPKQLALMKALANIQSAASRIGSTELTNVAMRVKMAEDHFVKVRALIKDLVAKLEADAESEATQKSYCDKAMKTAITDRDQANSNIEKANAGITTLTARKEQLKEWINELNASIAALQKSLLEATELRSKDEADHTKTITMSDEAIASVKNALELLQGFYGGSLVQKGKYTPPKSGRDGKTVGDMAPTMATEQYRGSGSESKGIIGILEVILSDFERTKAATESDEKDSKEAFETIERETKADVGKHQLSIEEKEGQLSETKSDLIDQQDALIEANALFKSSKDRLDDLNAMCVAGEESWEERKKKREEEIDALKDALNILENWQGE